MAPKRGDPILWPENAREPPDPSDSDDSDSNRPSSKRRQAREARERQELAIASAVNLLRDGQGEGSVSPKSTSQVHVTNKKQLQRQKNQDVLSVPISDDEKAVESGYVQNVDSTQINVTKNRRENDHEEQERLKQLHDALMEDMRAQVWEELRQEMMGRMMEDEREALREEGRQEVRAYLEGIQEDVEAPVNGQKSVQKNGGMEKERNDASDRVDENEDTEEEMKCIGLTRRGARCKNKRTNIQGATYCHLHQPLVTDSGKSKRAQEKSMKKVAPAKAAVQKVTKSKVTKTRQK